MSVNSSKMKDCACKEDKPCILYHNDPLETMDALNNLALKFPQTIGRMSVCYQPTQAWVTRPEPEFFLGEEKVA